MVLAPVPEPAAGGEPAVAEPPRSAAAIESGEAEPPLQRRADRVTALAPAPHSDAPQGASTTEPASPAPETQAEARTRPTPTTATPSSDGAAPPSSAQATPGPAQAQTVIPVPPDLPETSIQRVVADAPATVPPLAGLEMIAPPASPATRAGGAPEVVSRRADVPISPSANASEPSPLHSDVSRASSIVPTAAAAAPARPADSGSPETPDPASVAGPGQLATAEVAPRARVDLPASGVGPWERVDLPASGVAPRERVDVPAGEVAGAPASGPASSAASSQSPAVSLISRSPAATTTVPAARIGAALAPAAQATPATSMSAGYGREPQLVGAPQPVQRAIVQPQPLPLAATAPLELSPPVQREVTSGPEASGEVVTTRTDEPEQKKPNYEQMADAVWPHIRRKIRIERERERGLPS